MPVIFKVGTDQPLVYKVSANSPLIWATYIALIYSKLKMKQLHNLAAYAPT